MCVLYIDVKLECLSGQYNFFLNLTTIFFLNSVFDFKNGEKWYNGATYTSSQIFCVFFCIIFILITFMSDILFVYFQKNFNFQFSSFKFFSFFLFIIFSFFRFFHFQVHFINFSVLNDE